MEINVGKIKPIKGVDYFTEEEVAELNAGIDAKVAQVEEMLEGADLSGTDETARAVASGYYKGVDLEVKFADEIANFDNTAAWMRDKIINQNCDGLNLGDYVYINVGDETVGYQRMRYRIVDFGALNQQNSVSVVFAPAQVYVVPTNDTLNINYQYPVSSWKGGIQWASNVMKNNGSTQISGASGSASCPYYNSVVNNYMGFNLLDRFGDWKTVMYGGNIYMETRSATAKSSYDSQLCQTGGLFIPSEIEITGQCILGSGGKAIRGQRQFEFFKDVSNVVPENPSIDITNANIRVRNRNFWLRNLPDNTSEYALMFTWQMIASFSWLSVVDEDSWSDESNCAAIYPCFRIGKY